MASQKEWLSWAEDKADLVRDLIIFLIWTLKADSKQCHFTKRGENLEIEIPRDLC